MGGAPDFSSRKQPERDINLPATHEMRGCNDRDGGARQQCSTLSRRTQPISGAVSPAGEAVITSCDKQLRPLKALFR